MAPLTAEQQSMRRHGIGSSEVAALFGEDPWKSALDVWLVKTGRAADEGSFQTKMGHRIETLIAQEFCERNGVSTEPCGTYALDGHPVIIASPDRRIIPSAPMALLECKNVGWRVLPRWRADAQTFRAPPYVVLQAQYQCGVVDAAGAHIAAWLGGRDWHDEYHSADPELFRDLVVFVERWWETYVVGNEQPEPDGSDAAREALERLFPGVVRGLIPAPAEARRWALEYAAARERERDAKAAKQDAGNRLRALVGDAEGFVDTWGEVRWGKAGTATAWAKAAKEAGASAALIAKHTRAKARALKVKVEGSEDEDDDG